MPHRVVGQRVLRHDARRFRLIDGDQLSCMGISFLCSFLIRSLWYIPTLKVLPREPGLHCDPLCKTIQRWHSTSVHLPLLV